MRRQFDGGSVERALARMYARLGSRVVFVAMGGSLVLGVITAAVTMVVGARYLALSSAQTLSVLAIWVPIVLALALTGLALTAGHTRNVLAWRGAGRTPAGARYTWYAIVGLPRIAARCAALVALAIPPAAAYLVAHFHKPWYGGVVVALDVAAALAGIAALAVFATELVMRPMLEDVAAQLPADFEPRARGMRLRTRALAPLPGVTLFATIIVGAYANLAGDGTLRLTIVNGAALVTVAIASVIFLIITRSVLAPIDDLVAATERVRAGDITTPVPLVTTDELGELARSFNQMLADLRRQAEELRASRERIVAAGDAERRRVERDLHDGAQQQLVLLGMKLALAGRRLEGDPESAALIGELRQDLERALAELRDLAHGIYPAPLEDEGLPGALRDAAQRAAIPVTVACDGAGRYRRELEAAVYFCCLEALQNAAKHAGAGARATVSLGEHDHTLCFEIADDGQGYDPAGAKASTGVQNMTDRIGALGGTLTVDSRPGAGTTVAGSVPLER